MFKALTIAGSDSGGGAGIQADIKTFQELGVYGMSALTAITAQNTLGVHGVYPVSAQALAEQMDAVAQDLKPDALKTGMLFNAEIIALTAAKIKEHELTKLVIDPVMIAKGGASLLEKEAVSALIEELLPLAFVITPNIPEAESLTSIEINSEDDRKRAAEKLHQFGAKNVIIKGGHQPDSDKVIDLLFDGKEFLTLSNPFIDTRHTHGTGCTFSAALTAEIAKGKGVYEAFQTAARFVHEAIKNGINIGEGHGPTNHFAYKLSKNQLIN
ncbi:bifunctional hydroxymethylpyrimidine kinase/phosphomethylpyrimidine kinase [Bacillus gobiensis]|uniref:bifunctional hydroxymethylpyrimidine kinase/phosphomethylpyrimidine kinase n=1 Tax=Bacillus gobiensis TaxID=1441095 RepID=UPI003D21CA1B